MKLNEKEQIKLSNILNDATGNAISGEKIGTLRLTEKQSYGFDDFSFDYAENGTVISFRKFRNEDVFKSTSFIREDEILTLKQGFENLRQLIDELLKNK